MMLTLSGNCATNCEFQLQLAHSQLQLQLPQQVIAISFYNYQSLLSVRPLCRQQSDFAGPSLKCNGRCCGWEEKCERGQRLLFACISTL